jgi:hypothetical protein
VPSDATEVWYLTAWWKMPVCAAASVWVPVWAFSWNAIFFGENVYMVHKMTILAECAYVAAAATTGAFHRAVKHQALASSRSEYQLRIPEV